MDLCFINSSSSNFAKLNPLPNILHEYNNDEFRRKLFVKSLLYVGRLPIFYFYKYSACSYVYSTYPRPISRTLNNDT